MEHFDQTPVSTSEKFIPPLLLDFLLALEATASTDEIWDLILDLATRLGLSVVDYVYATDYRDWEKAQFIRTTFDSTWLDHVRRFPHIRHTSAFRMHGCRFLTPLLIGLAYAGDAGSISEDKARHMRLSAEMGMRAGVAFPLRMGDPGQAALMVFGGAFEREGFDQIVAEHGWTLHAAALSAHARYTELFKSEFIARNHLTDKQRELLTFVGQGWMDKQIAFHLGISFSAVRQRLGAVQQKTGAQNRADLAALAARIGLVPDPLLKVHDDDLTVFLSMGDERTATELRRGRVSLPREAC